MIKTNFLNCSRDVLFSSKIYGGEEDKLEHYKNVEVYQTKYQFIYFLFLPPVKKQQFMFMDTVSIEDAIMFLKCMQKEKKCMNQA